MYKKFEQESMPFVDQFFPKGCRTRGKALALFASIMLIGRQYFRKMKQAYGGCTRCYGKGYATQRSAVIGSPDFPGDKGYYEEIMRFIPCSCDRGKQIKKLKQFIQSSCKTK